MRDICCFTGGVHQSRTETKKNIKGVVETFCKHNDVTGVRIVMVGKHLNEMNAVKEHIPNATVLLCKCHVMEYLKKRGVTLTSNTAKRKY